MPMIGNEGVSILDYHYIFSENNILLEKNSSTLPDESVVKKCLDYQLAFDWFCEPQLNYTALLLESDAPALSGCRWTPLRSYFAMGIDGVPLAARAMSLFRWRRSTRFCGTCGGAMYDSTEETARKCILCGHIVFPTIEPAIIVLISKGDRFLLGRHAHRNTTVYTCIAGFVEQGETLEACVAREIREETAIEVKNIRYVGSQSWPFPDQLMLAFKAEWASGTPVPDYDELDDLQWFTRDNLPDIPLPGSVAYKLITGAI
jgi:NAD+ diphosphatase